MAAALKWATFALVAMLATQPAVAGVYQSVVVGTYAKKRDAQEAAKIASAKLSYPIAFETLANPPSSPVYAGKVVAVHREKGQFVVTVFLGDAEEAQFAHDHASMYFRKVTPAQFNVAKVDGSYLAHTPTSVVVAGVRQSYEEAVRLAQHLSTKTGVPYSTRGMIHTKDRGLIFPDTHPDRVLAGAYYARRSNACSEELKECITVERSEFYMGFEPGYYVVVGGIYRQATKSFERAEKLREHSPEAYSKNTNIYLGCVMGLPTEPPKLVDEDGDEWVTQNF